MTREINHQQHGDRLKHFCFLKFEAPGRRRWAFRHKAATVLYAADIFKPQKVPREGAREKCATRETEEGRSERSEVHGWLDGGGETVKVNVT
jgi:hypothetical protein